MRRKIIYFAFLLFLITCSSHKLATKASAVTCGGSDSWAKSEATQTKNLVDSDKQIRLRIQVGPGTESTVILLIKSPNENFFRPVKDGPQSFGTAESDVTDNLIEELIGRDGVAFARNTNNRTFELGTYTIAIAPKNITDLQDASKYYCTLPADFFEVKTSDTGPSGFCAITYDPTNNYTIKTNGDKPNVKIRVRFPSDTNQGDDTNHHHSILLNTSNRGTVTIAGSDSNAPTTRQLINGWTLPDDWSVGTYSIVVKEHTGSPAGENRSCESNPKFEIDTQENGGGGICGDHQCDNATSFTPNKSLAQPCNQNDLSANGDGCKRIKTSLGYVSTDASNFTRWVLGFILSISGGIVFLIVLITGYRLMTSQGDPEKVKNAKDQLTAAIIGLMFIIFSLAILELITRDILGLPGFR